MVKELSWYIESGRFSDIVKDIEEKAIAYKDALVSKSKNIDECREKFRTLCQWHIEKSGYKGNTSSFINVDDEFFNGTELNRTALNVFEKEIVKAHMYQKHLWEFMGTTGNMTIISKSAMQKDGFAYENYLPVEEKTKQTEKSPIAKELSKNPNAVPIYMYLDGTVSTKYEKERAKFCFDALNDKSGFDWGRKGWNPNYEVSKNGWKGKFDEDGVWRRVELSEDEENQNLAPDRNMVKFQNLELLKQDDEGILYDPGYSLLSIPEIIYLLLDDEVYGSEKEDVSRTVQEIFETMRKMDIRKIKAVVGGKSVEKKKAGRFSDKAETASSYKAILQNIASENLEIKDFEEYQVLKREAAKNLSSKKKKILGQNLSSKIQTVIQSGIAGNSVVSSVKSGKMKISKSFSDKKDRKELGLTEKEYDSLKKLPVPEERKELFERVTMNLLSDYEIFKEAGVEKEELFDFAYKTVVLNEKTEKVISIERSLKELCQSENNNFYCEKVDDYTLDVLKEEIRKVPKQKTSELQIKVDRALENVERNFKAIRESTGMTPSEAVAFAVKSVEGKVNAVFVPPVSGFVYKTSSSQPKEIDRRIFFDIPLSDFIEQAKSAQPLTKTVSLEQIAAAKKSSKNALNLFEKSERENWFESEEFKNSGIQKEELESFILEEEETFETTQSASAIPILNASRKEELNERYGVNLNFNEEPSNYLIANIEPKTISKKSSSATEEINKSVFEIAKEKSTSNSSRIAKFNPAELKTDGKLARTISTSVMSDTLVSSAFSKNFKRENTLLESEKVNFAQNENFEVKTQLSNSNETDFSRSEVLKENSSNSFENGLVKNENFDIKNQFSNSNEITFSQTEYLNEFSTDSFENNLVQRESPTVQTGENNFPKEKIAFTNLTANENFEIKNQFSKSNETDFSKEKIALESSQTKRINYESTTAKEIIEAAAGTTFVQSRSFEQHNLMPTFENDSNEYATQANEPIQNVQTKFESDFTPIQTPITKDSDFQSPNQSFNPAIQDFANQNPEKRALKNESFNDDFPSSSKKVVSEKESEKEKMERMTKNYENDREILAKTDPNFSKTTFKDVGHALSDSEFDFNTKTSKSNLTNDITDVIDDERL